MKWIQTETVNLKLLVPSGLTVAVAVGAGVGYVVAMKVLDKKYREIADAEIAEAKVFYQGMYSRPPLIPESDPPRKISEARGIVFDELTDDEQDTSIRDAVKAMGSYSPPEGDPRPDPTPPQQVINIFNNPTPPGEEVLEALMADRDPEIPYIITKQEYFDNDPDHEQRGFTYYEGDDVLVDDTDEYNPIQDVQKVAGEDNLLRFGYGSGDENAIYIRNESVDPPFDLYIIKSTGKYTDEVMGFDDKGEHLQHSHRPRKFRLNDD